MLEHSRAITLGLRKIFKQKNNIYLFDWEWTKLERAQGRVLRKWNSWYTHENVRHGYTNHGEVIGAGIGPGSNSNYFSIKKINKKNVIGFALEIIDQDNDFLFHAFDEANDYRRYWKDFNFHVNLEKDFKKFNFSGNLIYSRSLNYQWQLDDSVEPYYHAGKDVNNFHLTFKLLYRILN